MSTITPDNSSVLSPELSIPTVGRSRILSAARIAWLGLAACLFGVFLISIPGTYQMLQTPCVPDVDHAFCISWAQPTQEGIETLAQSGISLQAAALYLVCLYTVVSLAFWAVGLLIFRYRSDQWFTLLVSHLMILVGTGGVSFVLASGLSFIPFVRATGDIGVLVGVLILLPMYPLLSLFLLMFPNGKIYERWNAIPFVLICLNFFFWAVHSPILNIQFWPPVLSSGWLLLVFGSHILAQVVRYRKWYTLIERQQTKWLIYGFGLPVVFFFGIGTLLQANTISSSFIHPLVNGTLVALFYLPISLATGFAILRYRLWDIDVIIQRTLVYGALTVLVVGIYVFVVGVLSTIFQNSGNLLISLVATGIVAVAFQPLRDRLQQIVDKYVYGERNTPYAVISRLSERLETITMSGTLLPGIAEMVAQALKLPYVAIVLIEDDAFKTDAVYGLPLDRGRVTTLPLIYGQETVGQLVIGQMPGDKTLDTTDFQLLETIARQTGIAAHAIQLSLALQQSRQNIVTAREEERRRLRRDLHDGLGPTLAAHTIKVGAARALIESNPHLAATILTELETSLANSLVDIRRLVYNLRPPVLDQLGLCGALREFVAQYSTTVETQTLLFTLNLPDVLPALPAAVEVAAYRVVQEAVTNVIRHAHAQRCEISLTLSASVLILVKDDGIGLPKQVKQGVGLNAIRERAEELGGTLILSSKHNEGTQVLIRIPL